MNEATTVVHRPHKNRVGKTGIEVTELGFGTVALGLLADNEDEIGRAAVERALKRGISFFDTAPYYLNGRAERRLGDVLNGLDRSSYAICSKVGRIVTKEDEGRPGSWQPPFDYSYDGVMRSFETSLRRLRLDRVDVLLLHDIGAVTHGERHAETFRQAMDGGYRALSELKASGAVSAIGIGVNEWQVCEEAAAVADFDAFLLAGRYTLLEQTALDTFLPMCVERGISVLVGGPFNSGILAKGPTPGAWYNYAPAPEAILERVRRIQSVCETYAVALPTAALRFPGTHPAVASTVFGPKTAEEVDANLDQYEAAIDPELWDRLKSEGLLRADAPTPR